MPSGCGGLLPRGDGDLGESGEEDSRGQADEGYDGVLQEVQLSHQHVGGLGALRNLLHKVHVHLATHTRMTSNI